MEFSFSNAFTIVVMFTTFFLLDQKSISVTRKFLLTIFDEMSNVLKTVILFFPYLYSILATKIKRWIEEVNQFYNVEKLEDVEARNESIFLTYI